MHTEGAMSFSSSGSEQEQTQDSRGGNLRGVDSSVNAQRHTAEGLRGSTLDELCRENRSGAEMEEEAESRDVFLNTREIRGGLRLSGKDLSNGRGRGR